MPTEHGGDERREHGRDVEEDPRGDPRERDVPDPVADEGLTPLDEEEPDRRGKEPDDGARAEREAHELSLEHGRARGRARRRAGRRGDPSKTIVRRTSTSRWTKCSTAPNSCET